MSDIISGEREAINVLISVDGNHRDKLDGIAHNLEAVGMRVEDVFPIAGTIAGAVPATKIGKLQTIEGVASVEEEPMFMAY